MNAAKMGVFHSFHDELMYFIMIVVTVIGIFMAINYLLIYTLGFFYISNSGSANAQILGCSCPGTFFLNIGLNMFPFQALQLIVLVAFGAMD